MTSKSLSKNTYQAFVVSIQGVFSKGLIAAQKTLEYERLKTYWAIGGAISAYIAVHPEVKKLGRAFLKQVAFDLNQNTSLNISWDTLLRSSQFYKNYPKFPANTPLTFTHYMALLRIADKEKRERMESRAIKEGISSVDMKRVVSQMAIPVVQEVTVEKGSVLPLERGEPYVYMLKSHKSFGGENTVRIDCGFKIFKSLPKGSRHMHHSGRIVRVVKKDDEYALRVYSRIIAKRYTYAAVVSKVIDGDTIDACVDVGFGVWITDRFRLKGINTPELGTPEGTQAKVFVENYLKSASQIIIRTTKEGMYGRWLADVFVLKNESDPYTIATRGVYLNQLLLDKGLACKYGA